MSDFHTEPRGRVSGRQPVIAETALLYTPLPMLVYSDADADAAVGEGLDRKVANLLRIVGADADQAFA